MPVIEAISTLVPAGTRAAAARSRAALNDAFRRLPAMPMMVAMVSPHEALGASAPAVASAREAELAHHAADVVEEVLLDDLAIVPSSHGAEVDLEPLAVRRDGLAAHDHRALHRPMEPGD